MKLPLLIPSLALSACSQSADTFHVYDRQRRVRSANVDVCGRVTRLHRVGGQLFGIVPISCEGDGKVRLLLDNGREIDCLIGYVTSLPQTWRYQIVAEKCGPLLSP